MPSLNPSVSLDSVINQTIANKNDLVLAKLIQSCERNVFIVLGGPFITKYVHDLMAEKELGNIIDGFIIGDGEESLAGLIRQLDTERNFGDIPNFVFWKEQEEYVESRHTFHANTDYLLEPVFDGFKFYSMLSVRTSYGCHWGKCSFCTYCLSHQQFSQGNAAQIVAIIRNLQSKYHIADFRLVDDSLSPRFLKEFSETLLKEDLHIRWRTFLALVPGLKRTHIQTLAQSGCKMIDIGLESMSPRVLKLMGKPHSPERAKEIVTWLYEADILIDVNAIVGFPTETHEEAMLTLNFLLENRDIFSSITLQPFALEAGTRVFARPKEFGITKIYPQGKYGSGVGGRIGYRYEVKSGMTQHESDMFARQAWEKLARRRSVRNARL